MAKRLCLLLNKRRFRKRQLKMMAGEDQALVGYRLYVTEKMIDPNV